MSKNRLAAVGAFVIVGLLLFAVGLFLIGNRRMLFIDTFEVYAEFGEVASLTNGAKVRVAGVDAGEVEEIQVPLSPSAKFRVKMRVRQDLQPLIRLDSVATIQTDGLVGNKFVQIQIGSDASPIVQESGTIRSREPFDIADLMQKMSDTIDTVNRMLAEVKGNVDEALDAVAATAADAQSLMREIGTDVRTILASARRVSGNIDTIVTNAREGKGSIGKFLNDEALYTSVKSMASDAEKAMATVRDASEQARDAIADFRGDKGPVRGVMADMHQTMVAARETMSDLADATEALKRNFFFRGFFNRRGFFDLDEVTPAEYRQGALETKDRRVVRLWLKADVLFERDAYGSERLSAGGMARLDSAMAFFLRYPPKSPFVVEGYTPPGTRDESYLISRTRAQLVRDYLVEKYRLDPNYVAIMPLGADVKDSPEGSSWDGVGLAMFVPAAAIEAKGSG